MHQATAFFMLHDATFAVGAQTFVFQTIDAAPPCPALLVKDRRGVDLFAFPIRIAGRPNAEGWEVREPSGKTLRRVASFYFEDGKLVAL